MEAREERSHKAYEPKQELYPTLEACLSISPCLQERAFFHFATIFKPSTSHLLDHYELQAWFTKGSAEETNSVPTGLTTAYAQHRASRLLQSTAQILQ